MRFVLLALSLTAALPVSAWEQCRAEAPRDATVELSGATRLRVRARAGSLRIVGEKGLKQVVVHGRAFASDREMLESIRLRTDRSGDTIRVDAELPERTRSWSFGDSCAGLDLEIRVPESLLADVDDSSGDAEVSGVAALQIEDASGGLRIHDIAGEVRVRDRSGDIEIERVGSVVVDDDGSGGIEIRDVKGSVTIREDGSGSIGIRGVGGSVSIGETGSGGVRVTDVAGDLRVEGAGRRSSRVSYDGVRGRVDVPMSRSWRRR